MSVVLRLGDCLDVMASIPNGSIDLILADLPYQVTACKWDVMIPFEPLWAHYRRLLKPRGAVVLNASQPFTTDLISSNRPWFLYSLVWDKKMATGGQISHLQPMKAHEDVLVFGRGRYTYNPQMEEFNKHEIKRMRKHDFVARTPAMLRADSMQISKGWQEGRNKNPRSVIRINGLTPVSREKQSAKHPSQKPVALMEYLIRTYSNEGDTVLDNVMGGGTTGVACLNTDRNFIGIEKDPAYFAIAEKRIAAAREQAACQLF